MKVSIPAPLATLLWAALAALVAGYTVDSFVKTAENLPDAPSEAVDNMVADVQNTIQDTPPGQLPPLTPVAPSLLPKFPSPTPMGKLPGLIPVDPSLLPKLP